jgi:hypothetical protein
MVLTVVEGSWQPPALAELRRGSRVDQTWLPLSWSFVCDSQTVAWLRLGYLPRMLGRVHPVVVHLLGAAACINDGLPPWTRLALDQESAVGELVLILDEKTYEAKNRLCHARCLEGRLSVMDGAGQPSGGLATCCTARERAADNRRQLALRIEPACRRGTVQ